MYVWPYFSQILMLGVVDTREICEVNNNSVYIHDHRVLCGGGNISDQELVTTALAPPHVWAKDFTECEAQCRFFFSL
jgi:hypothetical protein